MFQTGLPRDSWSKIGYRMSLLGASVPLNWGWHRASQASPGTAIATTTAPAITQPQPQPQPQPLLNKSNGSVQNQGSMFSFNENGNAASRPDIVAHWQDIHLRSEWDHMAYTKEFYHTSETQCSLMFAAPRQHNTTTTLRVQM